MKKKDYKKLTEEKLEEGIKDLMLRLQKTYGLNIKTEKPENRRKIRKEIAKIKTEQSRRRNENVRKT